MNRKAFIDAIAPYYQEALTAWYRKRRPEGIDVIIFSEGPECMTVFVVPSEDAAPIIRESFRDDTMMRIAERIQRPPLEHRVWILLMGRKTNTLAQMDYRRHVYARCN